MTYVPTWKERLEDWKQYTGPAVALLVLLVLGGWMVWHEVLPREQAKKLAAAPTADEATRAAARKRLTAEVDKLERDYRLSIEAGEGNAAIASLLDRAIARQKERARLDPEGDSPEAQRLSRLEVERSSLRARIASVRSRVLEREAQAAPGTPEAMEKLREALRLQREANTSNGPGDLKDFAREARLTEAIQGAEIEPARAAVATKITLAHAALARGNTDEALKLFTEARSMQSDLSRRFPSTSMANPNFVEQIDVEIESLKATGVSEISIAREREAEALIKVGHVDEAAAALAAAAAGQREINEKYQRTKLVSAARADQLEVRRQTLLSGAPMARAAALDGEIAGLLRKRRNTDAAKEISAALAISEKAAADFPRSTALDRGLQSRLAYLGLRASELDALQETAFAQLVPLPGAKGVVMWRTEVSQDVYVRVMNGNPSRNTGRTLPVDSVSWPEAQEFCQRLGWLLGCRVRLPTEAEFRAAFMAGEDRAGAMVDRAWSEATSGGRTNEVGKSPRSTAGFFDLAGNVAEWLQPANAASDSAPVAGGSYLDAADALRKLPIVVAEKRERARHVGFRVVVELPEP